MQGGEAAGAIFAICYFSIPYYYAALYCNLHNFVDLQHEVY
jgi:hypothetical protein